MLQSDSTYWTYSIQLEQEVIHNLIMIRLEQKFIHNLIMIRTSKTSTQYHRVRLKSTITKFEKLTREPLHLIKNSHITTYHKHVLIGFFNQALKIGRTKRTNIQGLI